VKTPWRKRYLTVFPLRKLRKTQTDGPSWGRGKATGDPPSVPKITRSVPALSWQPVAWSAKCPAGQLAYRFRILRRKIAHPGAVVSEPTLRCFLKYVRNRPGHFLRGSLDLQTRRRLDATTSTLQQARPGTSNPKFFEPGEDRRTIGRTNQNQLSENNLLVRWDPLVV
jgi:hypothetical protein